jgi:riboflavin synthase
MFTGIVEETGVVDRIDKLPGGISLSVRARVCASDLKPGDSLAVNGCCLTAIRIAPGKKTKRIAFDLLEETWRATNLQFARAGSLVNLERALRADSRLGGHFVTGHIDGVGKIVRWEKKGADRILEISATAARLRHIVYKGSIAVDGISLTVAAVEKNKFRVWIIPHTFAATALCDRKVGDAVNLETDLLGKYVEKFISAHP